MSSSSHRFPEGRTTKHLDFGAGVQRRNPFKCSQLYSVDLFVTESVDNSFLIRRLDPLPFTDEFFDSVSAYDVLEHLSRDYGGTNEFIYYMNELYRVLKKKGKAVFVFPGYPSNDAFADPTHINFITHSTVEYFSGDNSKGGYAGIKTSYRIIMNRRLRSWKRWVDESLEADYIEKESLRRKISLIKRRINRALWPQHRIWVLEKSIYSEQQSAFSRFSISTMLILKGPLMSPYWLILRPEPITDQCLCPSNLDKVSYSIAADS